MVLITAVGWTLPGPPNRAFYRRFRMRILRSRLLSPLALGLTLLMVGCGGSNGPPAPTQTGPLRVGVIAPFSAPAAEFGKLIGAPCFAATDLINAAGGVMGHQLTCVPI